jgi:hypothetical protein
VQVIKADVALFDRRVPGLSILLPGLPERVCGVGWDIGIMRKNVLTIGYGIATNGKQK